MKMNADTALTCIVVDDEPLAAELLESYVRRTPFLEYRGSYYSAVSALEAIHDDPVDLLFCDIQMPGLSGMDLARMLPERTRVVFTTAFSAYAVEGFRVNALDYLVKPVSYPDFLSAADKAFKWFSMSRAVRPSVTKDIDSIIVKTEYRLVRIPFDDILYIEGLKDYVKIHVSGDGSPVLSLMNLKTLEDELPSGRFVRIHRSFIIQPSRMSYIEKGRVVYGQARLPVSDTYRQSFYDFLSKRALLCE